jgi:hypothetical protein
LGGAGVFALVRDSEGHDREAAAFGVLRLNSHMRLCDGGQGQDCRDDDPDAAPDPCNDAAV